MSDDPGIDLERMQKALGCLPFREPDLEANREGMLSADQRPNVMGRFHLGLGCGAAVVLFGFGGALLSSPDDEISLPLYGMAGAVGAVAFVVALVLRIRLSRGTEVERVTGHGWIEERYAGRYREVLLRVGDGGFGTRTFRLPLGAMDTAGISGHHLHVYYLRASGRLLSFEPVPASMLAEG